MFWFLVLCAAGVFIYYKLIEPLKYWQRMGVEQKSIWRIWLETYLGIIQYRCISDGVKKMYDDYPGLRYSGVYHFTTPILSVRDPELIKQITVKDFDHFMDHFNFFPTEGEPLWERGVFFLKGDKWKEMRNTLSPSFTSSKMKIMFGLMNDCAKQFVKYFKEQNEGVIQVEMKDTLTRFTNDIIATTAFGITCDSVTNRENEFYLAGKEVTTFNAGVLDVLKFIFAATFPNLFKKLGLRLFKKDTGAFFRNIIKTNIKSREENGIVRPDMIHILLEARKEKANPENSQNILEDKLSDDDIAAQAFGFFLAGFDSVATLMYFLAYELALHPDVQERLQLEIDDIINNSDVKLTYEHLGNMKYMDMVVAETLRKWPNALVLDRVCVKSYTIQPVKEGEKPVYIRKEDRIQFPIFGIHWDSEYYPEPDRFDPERFSDENKSKITPYTYLPFGSGPRICIGSRFALMETKVIFFHLLAGFDIVVTEKTPIPLVLTKKKFQLDCDEGFWVGLKPRKA